MSTVLTEGGRDTTLHYRKLARTAARAVPILDAAFNAVDIIDGQE
jgi:hypothetical protein